MYRFASYEHLVVELNTGYCKRRYINKHFNYSVWGGASALNTLLNMAAKDSAWEQRFDRTSFPTASSKQNAEENVVLSVNRHDGLQSGGQSIQDPYTRAIKYVEEHRIVEVFQVTIATLPF